LSVFVLLASCSTAPLEERVSARSRGIEFTITRYAPGCYRVADDVTVGGSGGICLDESFTYVEADGFVARRGAMVALAIGGMTSEAVAEVLVEVGDARTSVVPVDGLFVAAFPSDGGEGFRVTVFDAAGAVLDTIDRPHVPAFGPPPPDQSPPPPPGTSGRP
jgi:hypothetical protein